VFLVNSRSHLVTSTSTSSESKSHHRQRRTFSRSYGTNLPSSFTRVFSSALGFSPYPPVSVYGTVSCYLKLRGFSWKHGIDHFPAHRPVVSYLDIESPDLPKLSAYILSPGQPTPGRSSLLRPLIAVTQSTGILTSFPSTTPFGLALGADSPCAD
jgi:hypothetical protein